MTTRPLDFRPQRLAGRHQRLDSFYDDSLFSEGQERQRQLIDDL